MDWRINLTSEVLLPKCFLSRVWSQQLHARFAQSRYQQMLCVPQPAALVANMQMRLHCTKAILLVSRIGEMRMSIHLHTHLHANTVGSSQVWNAKWIEYCLYILHFPVDFLGQQEWRWWGTCGCFLQQEAPWPYHVGEPLRDKYMFLT